MKIINLPKQFLSAILGLLFFNYSTAQQNAKIAILGIESKGIINTGSELNSLIRIELEKLKTFEVIDKYDQMEILNKNNINLDDCKGKTCLISTGKLLNAEKVLSGSVERISEKIIISLKIYDVKSETVEKSILLEFINLQPEIQRMLGISLQKLLGLPTDIKAEQQLMNYEGAKPIPVTTLVLNGPRIGVAYTMGDNGKRLSDSKNNGGFDMYPVMSQFGWQQEFQYLSAGNFQGLIEFIFLGSGMETGRFIPSITFLNGFRNSRTGLEFAIGPSFNIAKVADGFYDSEGKYGSAGRWYLKNEYNNLVQNQIVNGVVPENTYPIVTRADSRGDLRFLSSLVIGVGKTFQSGYLNIPVNLFFSPRKSGSLIGLSVGFNINKGKK